MPRPGGGGAAGTLTRDQNREEPPRFGRRGGLKALPIALPSLPALNPAPDRLPARRKRPFSFLQAFRERQVPRP